MKKRKSVGKKSVLGLKVMAWLWFIFISVMLFLPGSALPDTSLSQIPFFDKFIHILFFALLTYLMLKAFAGETEVRPWIYMAVFIAYGVSVEFIQKEFIPNRSFDLMDIVADSIGVLAGYFRYNMEKKAISKKIRKGPPLDVMTPLPKK